MFHILIYQVKNTVSSNEDNLYPPPRFKGAQMFIDYMTEVLETRKIPKNSRYQIKKKLVKLK